MIKLYQYPGVWGMPSLSPFCSKVFYFLIWAKIPFEVVQVFNPRQGPKGKFPVIDDDGVVVADSEFIMKHCREKYGLNIEDPVEDLPIRRLLEEHLYFIILYSRWIDPENKEQIDRAFRHFFPKGMGRLVLFLIRRQLRKQAYFQGISRHSRQQIYQKGVDDLRAIEYFIAQGQQEECRAVDMSLYAFLQVIQQTPLDTPIRSYLIESQAIQNYLAKKRNLFEH
ncbi:Tom37 metaxin N-terminal-like domain-containing protein [Legionella anisa]|uniref:Glutathione S-transferase n=1 Tax=Legionella anisa TaxID=28082 RepID=A0AAX0WQF0_9GAMM|nr:Tom37 metaxin N-terminal-like domain-containing protein [Legionella anisa]AWN73228.1 glutathione S-transferase [Legionella anisa]KTC69505.1 hypothetical protein Lani_2694 [Legionella anisa]MBN5937677.1 glutathione S-transferase N-terminal domain-containing protein [Legionella anisa]MCW8424068.1 glutathione S-transferase N-terminal domain-containing protein [Legionella anisa]MCW8447591.1 glutathione S-transferase N-terminal domain-containing protein [Legionella anisa]